MTTPMPVMMRPMSSVEKATEVAISAAPKMVTAQARAAAAARARARAAPGESSAVAGRRADLDLVVHPGGVVIPVPVASLSVLS